MSKIKYCIYPLCALLLLVMGLSRAKDNNMSLQEAQNVAHVERAFQWFNQQMQKEGKLKRVSTAEVAQYFAEDARMVTNGKLICAGVDEHTAHFVEFQEKFASMHSRPFKQIEAKDDKVWLQYSINIEHRDGHVEDVQIMGYMQLKEGKISHFEELVVHA